MSPLDFPPITGLGETSVVYYSEPTLVDDKLVLNIVKKYLLLDMGSKKEHDVLAVQSVYEIPQNEINSRADVYEFYKDAVLALNEAHQYAESQMPTLPKRIFPTQPIESYQPEIDRVFNLLNSRN